MNQNNEVPTKLHAKLITVATIGAVGGFLFAMTPRSSTAPWTPSPAPTPASG